MDRAALLALIEQLGLALRKRGTPKHVALCRETWHAVKAGTEPPWDEPHLRKLAGMLELPGFACYPRGPRIGCPTCLPTKAATYTDGILPGVHLFACVTCGSRWLVDGTR